MLFRSRAMTVLQNEFRLLDDPFVNRIFENNSDKIIAFTRGDFLFVFNFHPSVSFTDYGIPVKGKFSVLFESDNPEFGGFDRIDRKRVYMSIRKAERYTINVPYYLYLYLPSRTVTVFRREIIRKATEI